MTDKMIIAQNFKVLREANGYTQEYVAKYLGITRSAYSNYETGDREPPLTVMEGLADLYGCDAYLFYEEDYNKVRNELLTAFRVDDLSEADMRQIAKFKSMVRNYLKLESIAKNK